MSGRYAIYFAPGAASPWHEFGNRWLGRDAATGEATPGSGGFDAGHGALTEEPRRYGWHATLKAPFRLACSPPVLIERVDELARQLAPVALGTLLPVPLSGFVALVPSTPVPALEALAERCVIELDDLRAAPTADEVARRNPRLLDTRGRELLARYGYPHVLERFRFHMTLTGQVDPERAGAVVAQVAPIAGRLNLIEPPVVDRLCIFHEPGPGAAFLRLHDAELGA